MPDMSAPTRSRARRKAERPAEILDAAFEEFAANGFAATRLEDVAKRAGVTKGTIYFYFETKERVFEEMIRHISQPRLAEFDHFIAALDGPFHARLRSLIVFFYDRMAENHVAREIVRLLISEGRRFPELVDRHYEEFIGPFLERLREVVEAGIEAGEFRAAPSLDLIEVIFSPALLMNLRPLLFGDRRPIDIGAYIDAHFDLLMNGLSPAPVAG
jgi:AcrR family transcriptional regulator